MKEIQEQIKRECQAIQNLLVQKNEKYGNSALEPKRIFSKATTVEQLLVRIDDKLSRIMTSGLAAPDEDTLQDLIGYLVLLKIATKKEPEYADDPSLRYNPPSDYKAI